MHIISSAFDTIAHNILLSRLHLLVVRDYFYADDIKLYMFIPTNSSSSLNNQLSNCVNDIKEWLISNNILLNTSKTILMNLSPSPTYFPPFLIDNIVISLSTTASNLGVLFILLFPSFLILLPPLNLKIIIYLELEKYENQLLYLLLKL